MDDSIKKGTTTKSRKSQFFEDTRSAHPDKIQRHILGLGGFLRESLTYLRPYWKQSALILLTLTPEVALETIQPMLLMVLIDEAILGGNHRLAILIVVALVGLLLVYAMARLANLYLSARIGAEITNKLRLKIFEHFQRLSVNFYIHNQTGDLISRFTSDLDALDITFSADFPYGISCVFTILVGTIFTLIIDWRLALPIIVLLPLIILGPRLLEYRTEKANYQRQQDIAQLVSSVEENISAQPVVKVFGLQSLMVNRFEKSLDQLFRSTSRASLLSGLQGTTMSATGNFLLALTLGVGALVAVQGELSVGALVALFELVWFVVSSLQELTGVLPSIQRGAAAMQRIDEILAEKSDILDAPNAMDLPPFSQEIVFHNIRFSYNGKDMHLNNINAVIPTHHSIAIVGPSGSGKSTLLSLIMRFQDPSQGAITFDGYDLRQVTQASLRSQMGVVFQENFLFRTSIRENIRLGKPEATDKEVEIAAREAEIHNFIISLSEGYDTDVGEKGRSLSGGERQRIALSRALLRRPAILILDEPASALDVETEAAINATLEKISKDITIISVTHRLISAVNVDLILVMEGGILVEQGNHEKLLRKKGVYYRLWQQQNGPLVGAKNQPYP
jgi:ATP-binding cassette subfamily B protein